MVKIANQNPFWDKLTLNICQKRNDGRGKMCKFAICNKL